MPTISVIIPNYNRAGLIGETLENLLRQTRAPDEIIVIDDGSTDNSAEVIAAFAPRVRLIRQANAGPAAARNRGLAEATGDYIQFFDSDDLCSLNKLEVQARALDTTDADFAYGAWLQARLESGCARHSELAAQLKPLPPSRSPLAWFLRGWFVLLPCCLFRRTFLDKVGLYRTDLLVAEDLELLFRMVFATGRPIHTSDALVLYRLHDAPQISRGGIADTRRAEDWLAYTRSVAAVLAQNTDGLSGSDVAQWRWTEWDAARQLARARGEDPVVESILTELSYHLKSRLKQWRSGFRRRLRRSSLSAPFGAAPFTTAQKDLIRALGYEPVLDPTPGG